MLWTSTLLPPEVQAGLSASEWPAMPEPPALLPSPSPLDAEAVLLIDVRSYAEFMAGHVAGARSLPLPRLADDIVHLAPDPDQPIALYCASGHRAEQALGLLQRLGYQAACNAGTPVLLARRLGRALESGL
ncbi:rhodanese-like domain-containing protein [Roseateles sp. DB2]|uniref:rhodanese-like domain-containing protein n=1 Tax=Roseateles sp. DB2 TaxID=3453717 RepID=UPI003EE96056